MQKHDELGVEERFFDAPRESSKIKHKVVVDYFRSWANVLLTQSKTIGYADLFAGPGQYKSGDKSIPMLIAETVIKDDRLRQSVRLWFNDGNPDFAMDVTTNVLSLPGIDQLKYKPHFTNKVVNRAMARHQFSIPTFVFADPCGYKGLSLALITSALQGFGNDCLFFFNYSRVNMKLSYPLMDESINEFFEKERAAGLRQEIARQRPPAREETVLNAIRDAIKEAKGIPVVFAFRTREGGGTSHHLVFASKHRKGAGIMKSLMTAYSSEVIDGVGSWDFDPSDRKGKTLPLFSPLNDICERLLERFAGRTVTFRDVLAEETVETQYTDANYRDAVLRLETEFRIQVTPIAERRRMQAGNTKRTLPAETTLQFPQ